MYIFLFLDRTIIMSAISHTDFIIKTHWQYQCRIMEWLRLEDISRNTLLKQGQLKQVVQSHVQFSSEYLKG